MRIWPCFKTVLYINAVNSKGFSYFFFRMYCRTLKGQALCVKGGISLTQLFVYWCKPVKSQLIIAGTWNCDGLSITLFKKKCAGLVCIYLWVNDRSCVVFPLMVLMTNCWWLASDNVYLADSVESSVLCWLSSTAARHCNTWLCRQV